MPIFKALYEPPVTYAPASILMAAACMTLLHAPEPALAAAALSAFAWMTLMYPMPALRPPCHLLAAAAPQRLWAAMRRPDVLMAAETQRGGCITLAFTIFAAAPLTGPGRTHDIERMAVVALPAAARWIASADGANLGGLIGPMAAELLHHASHAKRQPDGFYRQLLQAVCQMLTKLVTAARRSWPYIEISNLGLAIGNAGLLQCREAPQSGHRIAISSVSLYAECLYVHESIKPRSRTRAGEARQAAGHLLPKDRPPFLVSAAASEVVGLATVLVSAAMQQTVQPAAAEAYLSVDSGMSACLAAAPAAQQQAFYAAAMAELRGAVSGSSWDGKHAISILLALPALLAAVHAAVNAPAAVGNAAAETAAADKLLAVGRLMVPVTARCKQLQSTPRHQPLLAQQCPAISPDDGLDMLGGRVQLACVLAAACLAAVLQKLTEVACDLDAFTPTDGSSRVKHSPAAVAAAARFEDLAASGALTLLAAALTELGTPHQWRVPADAGCKGCAEKRIHFIGRACATGMRQVTAAALVGSDVSDATLGRAAEGSAAAIHRLLQDLRSDDSAQVPHCVLPLICMHVSGCHTASTVPASKQSGVVLLPSNRWFTSA